MAVPIQIASLTQSLAIRQYGKPHKADNGKFYVAIWHQDSNLERITIYQSVNPGSSWSMINNDDQAIQAGRMVNTFMDGNDLHVVAVSFGAAGVPMHGVFDVVTQSWTTSPNSTGGSTADQPLEALYCDIAVDSTGDIVVAYTGAVDAVKGDDKLRVDYARWNGSTWSNDNAVDDGGDVHYGQPNVFLAPGASDDVHIIYGSQTDNGADPPVTWVSVSAKTLSGASLSTVSTLSPAGGQIALNGISNVIAYNDGSNDIALVLAGDQSANDITCASYTEDGGGDLGTPTEENGDATGSTDASQLTTSYFTDEYHHALVYDPTAGDVYLAFIGGGTGGVDQDLYWTKSANDGSTWDAPTELQDAITANHIGANFFVRPGIAEFVGIVYGSTASGSPPLSETWTYHEYKIRDLPATQESWPIPQLLRQSDIRLRL